MRRDRQKQTLRLRLLALALALLLTWYAINPAPGSIRRHRRLAEEQPPEGERRANVSANRSLSLAPEMGILTAETQALLAEPDDPEDLDWPEYVSCD